MTTALLEAPRRTGFLADLRGPALGFVGPGWFTPVMGTGIVANAAATLPWHCPALLVLARGVWVLDVVLLLVVAAATVAHWRRHPTTARGHLDDPATAPAYGAPAMALMTVGAGALLVGQPVVGRTTAVVLDAVLWTAGTLLGLWTAYAVPKRALTRGPQGRPVGRHEAHGSWLMPVVPPMVSAATGPLLVPHLPPGGWRPALLLACAAMFGLALLASLVVIALVCDRLVRHGPGPAAGVPTLWIVLGPLGQSVTAAHTITAAGAGHTGLGVAYGVPVWGLALAWLALAATTTVRTARRGLPFSLAWWSFTFPVGTVVTGSSALAAATGSRGFGVAAAALYAGLVVAWLVVATRTAHGVYRGHLLDAPIARRQPLAVG
ncbi:TDT family transporter [Nocardioides rubriscoriae]|uniref:TDT family transporter n=1 Tax=Nocardioides rubriscoriae TaxID=642762 RepID=UPI001B8678D6|nr:TDT family transporter [Nocardioides rubriscoriae]